MRLPRRRVLAGAALAGAVLAGLLVRAADGTAAAGPPLPRAAFAVRADGTMTLPLDAYDDYTAPARVARLYRAATRIEQRCMRAHGVTLPAGWGGRYLPTPPPPLVVVGVTTLKDARTFGYRLPQWPAKPPARPSAATVTAFGGCSQQAYRALDIPDATRAFTAVQDLRFQAADAARRDPRTVRLNAAWSTCMRAAGYHYADPLGPVDDHGLLGRGLATPKGASLPPPSPIEKRVAVADVTCKQRTGYLKTYAAVLAGEQERVIAANGPGLRRVREHWSPVMARVATALRQD